MNVGSLFAGIGGFDLVAYGSALAVVLAFNHAAHRKPSPRPASLHGYSHSPSPDAGNVVTVYIDWSPHGTTGELAAEDTDSGTEVWA